MKFWTSMKHAAWAATILGASATGAIADTIYWEGVTGSWGATTNWTTNPLAVGSDPASVPGAGDTIVMNVAGANSSTALQLEGARSVQGILIASTANTNIRGGTTQTSASPVLSLGMGGITRPSTVTTGTTSIGSVTVASQPQDNVIVELTANQIWDNSGANSAGVIRADGPIRVPSSISDTNRVLTLTGTNTGINHITAGAAAGLSNGTGSGNTLAVEKTGMGLWIISVPTTTAISGTHTFSGGVTVTLGTLSVNGTSSTPTAGVVTSGPLGTGSLTMNGGTLLGSSSTATTTSTTNTLANNVTLNAVAGSTFRVVNGTTGTSTTTLSGVLGGVLGGGFTKTGNGVLVLTNANTYSGNTVIEAGGTTGAVNLVSALSTNNIPNSPLITVNGILNVTGLQNGTIALGASQALKGTGFVNGTIGGAGSVQPGASPGILSAVATDPSGGLDYSFEMTALDPVWSNNLASVNDVLRLTSPTTPFTSSLDGDNTVTVNFGMALSLGDVIHGGFFTDANSNFSALVSGTDWQFTFAGGSLPSGASIVTSVTQVASANFLSGTIANGWVTTFTVTAIPEPTSFFSMVIALSAMGLVHNRRRK